MTTQSRRLSFSSLKSIKPIQVLSYLAFVYAGLGFFNENYFHWTRSFWLSGFSEKVAIVVFGVYRVTQEKNPYTRKRVAILTGLIATIWIAFPYFTGSSFFNHHVVGSLWFFAYLAIIFLFGRRMDCAWNCPCVGIRDTAGNPFRSKTIRSDWMWKLRHVKWVFLASILIYLLLLAIFPRRVFTLIYARDFMVVNMGLYFASLLIIPWTGNRNYCRYLCPWGTLYGALSKLGPYHITWDEDACLECGVCEDQCDMGVPILSLVQEHGEVNVADCVGCARCVTECPTEALKIVDVRDAMRDGWPRLKQRLSVRASGGD